MPSHSQQSKASKSQNTPTASPQHALPQSYLTPEKKTKAVNYSPGKKPSRSEVAAAADKMITITPFNLLMELESSS